MELENSRLFCPNQVTNSRYILIVGDHVCNSHKKGNRVFGVTGLFVTTQQEYSMFVLEESHQNVRECQKRISRGNRFGFSQLPLDTAEQRTEKCSK